MLSRAKHLRLLLHDSRLPKLPNWGQYARNVLPSVILHEGVILQGSMSETQISQLTRRRISLFDSDGLPWTARLSMAWLIWTFVLTGGLTAIPIGLFIGI